VISSSPLQRYDRGGTGGSRSGWMLIRQVFWLPLAKPTHELGDLLALVSACCRCFAGFAWLANSFT